MRNLSRPIVGALGLAKVAPALCRFKPPQTWRMPAEAVAAEAGGADLPRVTRVHAFSQTRQTQTRIDPQPMPALEERLVPAQVPARVTLGSCEGPAHSSPGSRRNRFPAIPDCRTPPDSRC